jgi:hypothetical protein
MAISRIDYFSGVFPIEYDYLKKNNFFKAERFEFNYIRYGLFKEEDIEAYNHKTAETNILIGNNALPRNNHVDLFYELSNLKLTNIKLICPLSYAGTERYINFVCKTGNGLFGNMFYPIRDFLPYEQYAQIINSCQVAMFLIERQAAVGNILLCLWAGVKVFVSKTSINYIYLKQQLGLIIFSIQDDLNDENIKARLSREEVIHNRKIISETSSFQSWKTKLTASFSQIDKR